ncbi:MAG: hypothetical protein KGH61_02440 [Candidatus Micrarchaeota archaeon]|nr:hypothetical protein [Candidatus Micrarchaeota archaeon]MDE1847786.1 hypothetical protein [Candidatus Micrarchaeota archaeon]MDE1864224.1 hypothetical protein [Candidatus Micrarchaeota archaeon]
MDFWDVLGTERAKGGFGSERLVLSSKSSVIALNRPHTSLSMVKGKGTEIKINQAAMAKFAEAKNRYLIAIGLSYEIMLTIFDVNSMSGIAMRIGKVLDKSELELLGKKITSFGKANLEMRAIGMQSGDSSLVAAVDQVRRLCKAKLIEVDFFGALSRNVAFDLRTGTCYDILMLDRAYKAGELVNAIKLEEYKATISKLNFV